MLFSSRARMLEYSETTSFHLDIASPLVDAFVLCKCFSQRRIHKASTTRLLAGDDAGDPADKKHVQISFITITINLIIPLHVVSAGVASLFRAPKSPSCWGMSPWMVYKWSLVVLLEGVIQIFDLCCLFVMLSPFGPSVLWPVCQSCPIQRFPSSQQTLLPPVDDTLMWYCVRSVYVCLCQCGGCLCV